jgi:hypothetical protein
MADIEHGDTVVVVMSEDDVFSWQVGRTFRAVLTRLPQGPGDTYGLRVLDAHVHLNANSSKFVALWKARGGSDG